ncbi:FAD-binding oxidoreductase [Microbacterium ulmi]|uniref:FAD-binding protein n=1 Tax=Microbacterium ulmi TaxID=179095 RepID=A0A7Y2Q2U5_9MICO|nr:FAD-binding protein [Microbacterium ulmi]NII69676.1 glycolate oxidase [Microbacterium ulmi]NNH05023.1 FAD-binding protein [Microbacterium ulmi]
MERHEAAGSSGPTNSAADADAWTAFLSDISPLRVDASDAALVDASTDRAWTVAPVLPRALVRCESVSDVVRVLRAANLWRIPVVPRGAGTGLSGGAAAVDGCVVLDLSRMDRILEIDPVSRTAVVEAGVINKSLDVAVAVHDLAFAPDPASSAISTVGGNIATNAGGLRCVKYGTTRGSVLAVRVVLADGEVVCLGGKTRKNATGLDLLGLIVGSEGSLGVIVEATVALIPRPWNEQMILACFDDESALERAAEAVARSRVVPAAFEMMDRESIGVVGERLLRLLDIDRLGAGLLIVRTDGAGASAEIEALAASLSVPGVRPSRRLSAPESELVMQLRRGSGVEGVGDPQVGSDDRWWLGEDMTLPIRSLARYLRHARSVAASHEVRISHIAHLGDGNVHPSLTLAKEYGSEEDARTWLQAAADELVRFALAEGGALTGEHGVGLAKLPWIDEALSLEVREIQRRVKRALDPNGILNPGKAL